MNAEEIFLAAIDKPTHAERQAFVDTACGGDTNLRVQVLGLLRSHEGARSFLEAPLFDPAETLDHSGTSEPRSASAADEIVVESFAPSTTPGALGRIGSYEVIEMVGRGGMGVVLKARDSKLQRIVAIKLLVPELALNLLARKRFLREAQAAAAVVHQHVVTIHAVGDDPQPYLVMEFIEGQSLHEKINRNGYLGLVEILRIGQQIALALAAAHAQGLVHRDVKPANVLLENGVERVRITDFGLARAVDDVGLTRTGEVAGTPQYMSPEQAQGLPLDERSDLFSLGCVLYAMCTGRPPFPAQSTIDAIRRVCDDRPRPIRETNAQIPSSLVTIIDRLLAKQPEERFQSAQEVAELLGKLLANRQQGGSMSFAVPPSKAARPRRFPRRWLAMAATLCAVVAGLGLTEASGVTHLMPTVIRIVVGEGVLVIETDDPAVRVAVDGQDVKIQGAGIEELRLRRAPIGSLHRKVASRCARNW